MPENEKLQDKVNYCARMVVEVAEREAKIEDLEDKVEMLKNTGGMELEMEEVANAMEAHDKDTKEAEQK